MKEYEISGSTYIQDELVIGQWAQILDLVNGLVLHPNNAPEIIRKIPAFMAILLTPEGQSPQNKDLNALTEEFEWGLDIQIAEKVIADFIELCGEDLFIMFPLKGISSEIEQAPSPPGLSPYSLAEFCTATGFERDWAWWNHSVRDLITFAKHKNTPFFSKDGHC